MASPGDLNGGDQSKLGRIAYYATKLLLGGGMIALAAYDLGSPDTDVPTVLYGLVAGLAGGPELVSAAKGIFKS